MGEIYILSAEREARDEVQKNLQVILMDEACRFEIYLYSTYFAKLTARVSRITVIFTCPG